MVVVWVDAYFVLRWFAQSIISLDRRLPYQSTSPLNNLYVLPFLCLLPLAVEIPIQVSLCADSVCVWPF
jgi:hypothetical protein